MSPDFVTFVLIFVRAFSFCMFLPFNCHFIGIIQKGGLALFFSVMGFYFGNLSCGNYNFSVSGVLIEFLIGAMLAIPLLIVVEAALLLADLIDIGRGQQLAGISDLQANMVTSNMGLLFKYCLINFLFLFNILTEGCEFFIKMLETLKLGGVSFDVIENSIPVFMLNTFNFLSDSFYFYLPLALIFFICDLCFAVVVKLVPFFHPSQEGFVLKSLITFLFLIAIISDDENINKLSLLPLLPNIFFEGIYE